MSLTSHFWFLLTLLSLGAPLFFLVFSSSRVLFSGDRYLLVAETVDPGKWDFEKATVKRACDEIFEVPLYLFNFNG